MAVQYEWDAETQEACPVTGEVIEHHHDHHNSAGRMFQTMERYPVSTPRSYHPVVVRDIFNRNDELTDRQWAYLVKGRDGKWTLPEFFTDGCGVECAKVTKALITELEKAQK